MNWPVTCAQCGDRIGVYEPAVVIEPHGPRRISLLNEPELLEHRVTVLHTSCAEEPVAAGAEVERPSAGRPGI